jgi:hypothetical protein
MPDGRRGRFKLRGKTEAELSAFNGPGPNSTMNYNKIDRPKWELALSGLATVEGAGGRRVYYETGAIHMFEDMTGKGHGAQIREPGVMLLMPVAKGAPRMSVPSAQRAIAPGALFFRHFTAGASATDVSPLQEVEFKLENGVYKLPGTDIVLHRSSARGAGPWHNQKEPEYAFVVHGSAIIESKTGEVVRLGPGSIANVEDATGSGHRTITQGPEDMVFLTIPIVED